MGDIGCRATTNDRFQNGPSIANRALWFQPEIVNVFTVAGQAKLNLNIGTTDGAHNRGRLHCEV